MFQALWETLGDEREVTFRNLGSLDLISLGPGHGLCILGDLLGPSVDPLVWIPDQEIPDMWARLSEEIGPSGSWGPPERSLTAGRPWVPLVTPYLSEVAPYLIAVFALLPRRPGSRTTIYFGAAPVGPGYAIGLIDL